MYIFTYKLYQALSGGNNIVPLLILMIHKMTISGLYVNCERFPYY